MEECLNIRSHVGSCLYHIFRKMFIDTECESEQLSIF